MMPKRLALAMAPAIALMGLCLPAAAQTIDSVYTDLDLALCTVQKADDFGAVFACPGYKGTPLMVAEGDLRFFLSYGFRAYEETVAGQTLAPFNTLGPRLEWRISNRTGDFRPFATIVRYRLDDGDPLTRGVEILVVSRVAEGNSCHIGYVRASGNPDANDEAREIADRLAPDFDCRADAIETVGDLTPIGY
ncbi:hypothetical protein EMQ25_14700 [Arsenicitalea aurantiaca]|uniref:Uncharacterized protein n=1 Tax=Arsenicitalea aurantiaca TaxID=1783274 RepID=A0A433X5K5_9HYPH|nr:hypothetical protein [Arsenicitalea aurantiaca]RUT29366.1 hypothetical protein EMQ25_14700 [Arsenicitalea aurantiaca]